MDDVGAGGVVAARLDWNKLGWNLSGKVDNVNALTSETAYGYWRRGDVLFDAG